MRMPTCETPSLEASYLGLDSSLPPEHSPVQDHMSLGPRIRGAGSACPAVAKPLMALKTFGVLFDDGWQLGRTLLNSLLTIAAAL